VQDAPDPVRASELEIALAMSEPPPRAEHEPKRAAPPHLPTTQPKIPFVKPLPPRAPERTSDAVIEVLMSDRPMSLAPQQMPTIPAPPSAAPNVILTPRVDAPNPERDAHARDTRRPPGHAKTSRPRSRADAPSSQQPSAAPNISRAPRHPFEPAQRLAEPAASRAPRNPLDPAQPGASRAPRNPLDPAQPVASRPPRNPLDPAQPVAFRAARNPLEPAAAQPQPSSAPTASKRPRGRALAKSSSPQQRPREPLPEIPLAPAPTSPAKPGRRGIWLIGAVAAIGCSALFLYRNYDSAAVKAPGNPAAGALVETPVLQEPVAVAPAPIAAPQPSAAPSTEPTGPAASTTPRTASTRRAGESAPAPDLTTAAGRARALVDSGSAMVKQGRLGLAESMYMKAMQEVPEYPPAMTELVRVHLARRDGKEAVRWAELLVAKQSSGVNLLLLGDAQALRGSRVAAEATWTKAAAAGNATAKQRLGDAEE
jgi:hypothetical protein